MVQEEFGWVWWKSSHSREYRSLLSVQQWCRLMSHPAGTWLLGHRHTERGVPAEASPLPGGRGQGDTG